jgi:AcrR family transcriptional regulator
VAERAGANKALVFYYFGSTEALFEQVLHRYYRKNRRLLAQAFETQGPIRNRLRAVIDALFDFMIEHRTYARIVQEQLILGGPHSPLVRRHLKETVASIATMLESVTPATGPLSPLHIHHSVSAMVTQYFTSAEVLGEEYWGRDPMSKEALAERRAHLHWAIDAWLDALERGAG